MVRNSSIFIIILALAFFSWRIGNYMAKQFISKRPVQERIAEVFVEMQKIMDETDDRVKQMKSAITKIDSFISDYETIEGCPLPLNMKEGEVCITNSRKKQIEERDKEREIIKELRKKERLERTKVIDGILERSNALQD